MECHAETSEPAFLASGAAAAGQAEAPVVEPDFGPELAVRRDCRAGAEPAAAAEPCRQASRQSDGAAPDGPPPEPACASPDTRPDLCAPWDGEQPGDGRLTRPADAGGAGGPRPAAPRDDAGTDSAGETLADALSEVPAVSLGDVPSVMCASTAEASPGDSEMPRQSVETFSACFETHELCAKTSEMLAECARLHPEAFSETPGDLLEPLRVHAENLKMCSETGETCPELPGVQHPEDSETPLQTTDVCTKDPEAIIQVAVTPEPCLKTPEARRASCESPAADPEPELKPAADLPEPGPEEALCPPLEKSASLPLIDAPPEPAGDRRRRVSFPESDVSLVTGYIEPRNPLGAMYNASPEVISAAYRQSCHKHGARPLPAVLRQIGALPLIGDRVESFSLRGLRLDRAQCESLEEVLKKVQFNLVDVSGCGLDDDSAAAIFEMVEFYDSALAVSFGGNRLGVRGWQACCRMIKTSASLERLSAEGVELYDQSAAALGRSLRLSPSLRVLHLEGCRLHGRPMALLIAGLKQSPALKELYLGENELGTGDGSMLGNMLKLNVRLDLVDLRINHFDNDSVSFLLEALAQQPSSAKGEGLASLNLWCNRFTVKSAGCLATLLSRHASLETLNLGRNALGDETLRLVKEALMANGSLRRLGLQECRLTCEGAVALAEILADNGALQRIDLRGNDVRVGGLLALARALEHNTRLLQLDLDPAGDEPERLMLHARLRSLCEANRQRGLAEDEAPRGDTILRRLSAAFRRVSLTCDAPAAAAAAAAAEAAATTPAPAAAAAAGAEPEVVEERRRLVSPSPSPSSSPLPSPCRSRFRVFKVAAEPAEPGSPPVAPGVLQRPQRSSSESDASGSPSPSPVRSAARGFRVTPVLDPAAPPRPKSVQ